MGFTACEYSVAKALLSMVVRCEDCQELVEIADLIRDCYHAAVAAD